MHRHAPSREEVLASRWLKPFGQRIRHSELWRFTRRSVPRGVFARPVRRHLPDGARPADRRRGAAVRAVARQYPDRGGDDLPVQPADDAVLPLSRRSTSAARIGFHTDLAAFVALRDACSVGRWLDWLLSDAAPALVTGLFLIGLGVALVGYMRVARRMALVGRPQMAAAFARAESSRAKRSDLGGV